MESTENGPDAEVAFASASRLVIDWFCGKRKAESADRQEAIHPINNLAVVLRGIGAGTRIILCNGFAHLHF
jgi:hypothetical protein